MTPRTVILAAGAFPAKGGVSERVLREAVRVVACDGAAKAFHRRFGRWPDAIVGDLDSLGRARPTCPCIRIAEQETNDLTKAIRWCRAQGWRDLAIVGAVGRREDHAIGNLFRALDEGVCVVTDEGTFHPVAGRATFRAPKGTAVSVFAPDRTTHMTSEGLVWSLDNVRFATLYAATLNRTSAARFTVTTDRPCLIFVAE